MQTGSLNAAYLSTPRPRNGEGNISRQREPNPEAPRQQSQRQSSRVYTASQAQLVDSLRRFVSLSNEADAQGERAALPLRSRHALDAYVGTRRDEERAFLHEVMGVDTYA